MAKTVIIIAGPTAAGKTSASLQLAQQLNTEIISADSRQCYREMTIGVAKPSPDELAAVPHHFIDSHTIYQPVNAADFEQYALEACARIFEKSDYAVMVGGTGLYIKAFCEGLDKIPAVPRSIHDQVNAEYQANGLIWLQQRVQQLDPLFYGTGEVENPHRLLRALEVFLATGNSIKTFQVREKIVREFNVEKIGIAPEKEILHRQINQRVDQMMAAGQLEEARGLYDQRYLVPLQTVGYAELFEFFDGKVKLEEAVENIKLHTRQYAKRQMTWFKRDGDIRWNSIAPPSSKKEGQNPT